ncbi:hypothetical protein APHAL10511_004112 [Amanita phalloides]|nr:hypothetical protein APHAL10511_004112 [Amanita phalloides]
MGLLGVVDMAPDFDPTKDLVELDGRVVIVTGGNRGIGFETVRCLARAGAKVYLACRNEEAGTDAIQRLKSDGFAPGNGEVIWLKLDLSDPREAKKAAEEFLKLESRLDILINNAGMMKGPLELSSDGVSMFVVTNHISPFVFTRTLIPLMSDTARQTGTDVRIVNLSSDAHRDFPLKEIKVKTIEDLNFDSKAQSNMRAGLQRYAHTKALNILWTKTLQKQFDNAEPPIPITAIAVHPGIVKTFGKDWPLIVRLYALVLGVEATRGAYNSVFAAASKRVADDKEKYKGKFIGPKPKIGTLLQPTLAANNDENAEDLWNTTEGFLRKISL